MGGRQEVRIRTAPGRKQFRTFGGKLCTSWKKLQASCGQGREGLRRFGSIPGGVGLLTLASCPPGERAGLLRDNHICGMTTTGKRAWA